MPDQTFNQNVVILTGASSGIGYELALLLAEQGAWLALAARRAERLEELAVKCRELGGRALIVPTDVAVEMDCKALVERTVAEYERIDTLVNNAGRTMWARFDELQTLEPLHTIMQVNYFGSVYCTHYALPYLKQTRGRIVAISSMTGKTGVPMRTGYSASKHALVGFFEALRVELQGSGVTVSLIFPDFVATETRYQAFGADGAVVGESHVREGEIMSARACARLMLRDMEQRKRQDLMSLRGKLGQWVKLIAPGVVDNIARRAIEKGK